MPRIIPNVGDNVSLFHMEGDGSHATYGVVRERDGDAVLIEETHVDKWLWDKKTQTGKHIPIPILPHRFVWPKYPKEYNDDPTIPDHNFSRRSLKNWLVHEDDDHDMYNIFEMKDKNIPGISHCHLQIVSPDFFSKLEEIGPVPKQSGG